MSPEISRLHLDTYILNAVFMYVCTVVDPEIKQYSTYMRTFLNGQSMDFE